MKKRQYILPCILIVMVACIKPSHDRISSSTAVEDSLTLLSNQSDTFPVAICLWEKAGLREAPGRNKNIEYITPILLGEQVFVLGPTERKLKENRNYMKVRLSDGQEGWVHSYLFSTDSRSAVVLEPTNIYRRPDPLMLKPEKLKIGDFIVVVDEKDNWFKVIGREKKVVGWIQSKSQLSEQYEDVRLAVLYARAQSESELSRKVSLLENILESAPEKSSFVDLIERDLELSSQELNEGESGVDSDPLKITANQSVSSR